MKNEDSNFIYHSEEVTFRESVEVFFRRIERGEQAGLVLEYKNAFVNIDNLGNLIVTTFVSENNEWHTDLIIIYNKDSWRDCSAFGKIYKVTIKEKIFTDRKLTRSFT